MKLKTSVTTVLITLCASALAQASPASLARHLTPENILDLPLEMDEDTSGNWSEIWLRAYNKLDEDPKTVMEQGLGVKWLGLGPDRFGKPKRVVLVYAEKYIVDFNEDKTKFGKIDSGGEQITWQDGSKEALVGFKKVKRRHRHSRRRKKVNFGKVNLPPVKAAKKDSSPIMLWGLEGFLNKAGGSTEMHWDKKDLALISNLNDSSANLLKMKYANSCSLAKKEILEKLLVKEVEPKLSCWAEQNPEKALPLISVLLQKPLLECTEKAEESACGKATLPYLSSFFITQPQITFSFSQKCKEQQGNTFLHEVLHLVGIKEGEEMDAAIAQAESCESAAASLNFDNEAEEFFNDLQVETRLLLFKKVREEATEKWGWNEADKSFVLGQICTKMGDKYCARRFFQLATENTSGTIIKLPEGGETTFRAAAHYLLFDSITEDRPRMHELAQYLPYDPQGILIKRMLTEDYQAHEFYVARSALAEIKKNKGVCNDDTDDRVSCDDLAQIIKFQWFKN